MTPGAEITGPGHGRTLSWRSRNSSESNWWTSALELSSTLASKMDQVGVFFNNLYVKVNSLQNALQGLIIPYPALRMIAGKAN